MVEAQGLQGIPKVPQCPPLLVMGVNSSGGSWVDGGGSCSPLLPRPQPLLGSILLINTGSGTRLCLLSLVVGVGMEVG